MACHNSSCSSKINTTLRNHKSHEPHLVSRTCYEWRFQLFNHLGASSPPSYDFFFLTFSRLLTFRDTLTIIIWKRCEGCKEILDFPTIIIVTWDVEENYLNMLKLRMRLTLNSVIER